MAEYALDSNVSSFSENFLSVVHEFYLKEQFCDILIENKKSKFFVHKLVLAAHSNYFKTLLQSDQLCNSIKISDGISRNALEALVSYMYTGLVTISNVVDARQLLETATLMEVSSVIAILKDYLANHDREVNAVVEMVPTYPNTLQIKLEPIDKILNNLTFGINEAVITDVKPKRTAKQPTKKCKKLKKNQSRKNCDKNCDIGLHKNLQKCFVKNKKKVSSNKSSLLWLGKGDRFVCKICYNGFKYKIGLYCHVKYKHPGFYRISNYNIFRNKLKKAKFNFFKYSLVDQEKLDLGEAELNFLCKLCKKFFPKKSLCIYHIRSHLKDGFMVSNFTKMKFFKRKSSKIYKTPFSRKNIDPNLDEDKTNDSYECDQCPDKKLLSEYEMTVHMRSIHPEVLHKCIHCTFQTRIDRVLKSHLTSKHRSRKLCTLCGKSCSRTAALNLHMLLIHKIKKFSNDREYYECSEPNCDYVCLYKKRIEEHQLKHKQIKNYTCDICSKKFKHLKGLDKHKTVIHDNIRPFICDVCGQSYGQESDLKTHILRHDSNKPHACNMCSYASQYKANLQSHLFKIHQVVMNDKMLVFSCEECPYITNRRCRYNDHIKKKHQKILDIPCNECNKMFATKQNLYGHITAVHKPKSLLCSYCSYSTSLHHALKEHIKIMHTHRNVKNFECTLCGFRSATSGNCRKHIQRLHMNFEVAPKFVGDGEGGDVGVEGFDLNEVQGNL